MLDFNTMKKYSNSVPTVGGRVLRLSLVLAAVCSVVIVLLIIAARPGEVQSGELSFTILHTNDEHSALLPHTLTVNEGIAGEDHYRIGGFARLAMAIEQVRQEKQVQGEPVLLFNAGDFLGGAAFGWLAPHGYSPEIKLLQEMGYDAVVIGNHEYDYGPDTLADYLLRAGYPGAHQETVVLAANTRAPEDHPLASRQLYLLDQVFELKNGLKIGVFGLIGEDAINVTADTGELEFQDQSQVARDALSRLEEQGADVIVAVTHSGVDEDRELARDVPGIDIIVGGHCHTALDEPVMEGKTIIVQAGYMVEFLGQLELAYDPAGEKVRVRNEENETPFLLPIDDRFEPHPGIASLVDAYKEKLDNLVSEMTDGRFEDILAAVARSDFEITNRPPLQETPAGNFITDAMRLVTEEVSGERMDVAIQANGSIRGSFVPVSEAGKPGKISFYDITGVAGLGYGDDVYPGYSIITTYLTGEELLRLLEVAALLEELMGDTYFLQFSGLRYSYNPQNIVLFTIPFMDQPLPSTRAVVEAELYSGEGVQPAGEGDYQPLEKGDETLYRLVTDTYILSFLPMVGELLPGLEIVPKNAAGEPVPLERKEELTVPHRGRELKVWETVVEYAASQPPGEDGVPAIPELYSDTSGRINQVSTFPLVAWIYLGIAALAAGFCFLLRRRWRRNKMKHHASFYR